MGESAAAVTPEHALDMFLSNYYRDRPVTATFTGIHRYDEHLPDWSPDGIKWDLGSTTARRDLLRRAGDPESWHPSATPSYPDQVDLALADGFLEIQEAEARSPHFHRGNPSLWIGEAVFSIVSLVTRDFAPAADRLRPLLKRLRAIPAFFEDAKQVLVASPLEWKERSIREAEAAKELLWKLTGWIPQVCPDHATTVELIDECVYAGRTLAAFGLWIDEKLPTSESVSFHDRSLPSMIELVLRRGHWIGESPSQLIGQAGKGLLDAERLLAERVREAGCVDWPEAQARLADRHPTQAGYLARFGEIWTRAREAALAHDLVTWPNAPIRYVPIPEHTRDAAPNLYYLFYRSPAAFDRHVVYDYVVTPIEADLPTDEQQRRLRAANDSVITLNHVIHHGGLGHHVQNWHAYRSVSRIGQVAAIDCASRIAMICGGTLAEGWACYACGLMEEIGFLTPLERTAQQHTRIRLLARAIVDLELHTGNMTIASAVKFYQERAMMPPAAATAEAVKNSMFPGAAVMYWLGTRGIHELRTKLQAREGPAFSLKKFHDRFLSYGAIPVALISRLMLEES